MKKLNWLFFTLFAITIFACKDEESLDQVDPTIEITSPQNGDDFTIGESVTLAGTISDNIIVEEVRIVITGATNFDALEFQVNTQSYTLNQAFQIQEGVWAAGNYDIEITAEDAEGNTASETINITILEGTGGETALTFVVTDWPENTPEGDEVYIAGEFEDGVWSEPGTNDAMLMTANDDGTYSITLEPGDDDGDGIIEYKFFRGPAEMGEGTDGWAYGETDIECNPRENRSLDPATEGREVNDIEILGWEDICEPLEGEGTIGASGFDEGFNTLGAVDDDGLALGTPVTYNFAGAAGIDSVNVSAITEDGRETVNQGYNQAWFDDQGIDNTGDFEFTDDVRFPNVAAAEGATEFVVSTFRDGQQINREAYNTTVAPAAGARRVNFNVMGPADMPEGTRFFTSGDFQPNQYSVNDPNYELTRNAETGAYQTSMFTTGDLNYSYSALNEDGTTSWEVDEECVEAVEGAGSRNYVYAEREVGEGVDDDFDETINFTGYGDCIE